MGIKSWVIAGLVVIFCIPLPAAPDVGDLLHRQTQELMDAAGNGARSVWERYLDAGAVYTDGGGSVMSKPEMLATIRPFAQGGSGKINVIAFKVAVHGSTAVDTHVDD